MLYLDRAADPEASPLRWLQDHLPAADALRACVGYLDRAGVNLVAPPLLDVLERGGQIHLVVDHRDGHPRHADMAWLLDVLAPFGERASLTLVNDVSRLHAKVFYIAGTAGRHALIGSANFTAAGLSRNFEAGIALGPDDDTVVLDAIEQSTRSWVSHESGRLVDLGILAAFADLTEPPSGSNRVLSDLMQPALDELEAASALGGAVTGIPTGFTDLDRLLNGLHPGQLVLVAGRPGMGKSTLALDVARSAAVRRGLGALFLSFEMGRTELTNRLLSAEARVPLHVLRSGQLSDGDWTKLARRMGEISEVPFHVNDSCVPSIRQVVVAARKAVEEDAVKLIVVDYIQLLHVDRRIENRQQEVSEISRALKQMARELHVPVLAVSQLNRAPDGRVDKRPVLSDLRESGALEQDADVVIMLHRDDYYDKESPRAGEADFIVAKHRNGPTDTITVAAQLHLSRFVDIAIS